MSITFIDLNHFSAFLLNSFNQFGHCDENIHFSDFVVNMSASFLFFQEISKTIPIPDKKFGSRPPSGFLLCEIVFTM